MINRPRKAAGAGRRAMQPERYAVCPDAEREDACGSDLSALRSGQVRLDGDIFPSASAGP